MNASSNTSSMTASKTFLIMAGGTGGHIFPALAVADVLRERGHRIVWLGTRKGLEAELVPKAGIPIEWVNIAGLRGKGFKGLVLAPAKLVAAVFSCVRILQRLRPDAVLGMGGYASGPGGVAAWLLRRPLVIHEQNAVAGKTNSWLSRVAKKVLCGFNAALPNSEWVGNPVRADIAALPAPAVRYADRSGSIRLLVVGGSLGAQALNETVPAAVAQLQQAGLQVDVKHQTGKRTLDVAQKAYEQAGITGDVTAFIDDMAAAYSWADVLIARAGALTCAEIAAAGLPAILVPFPHAVDDHQTANASALEKAGAAKILQQRDMTADSLATTLREFAGADRAQLKQRAEAARLVAKPQAAARISDVCAELAGVNV